MRAADLHARRAAVLRSLSRIQEAVDEYERALALFDWLGDDVRFVETCAQLWLMHLWARQFQEAKAVVDRAAEPAQDAPASIRCTLLAMQAVTASTIGETDKALDLLKEIHKIPENELTPRVIGFTAAREVAIRFEAGRMEVAEAAARKATRIFEQSGDIWSQAGIEFERRNEGHRSR